MPNSARSMRILMSAAEAYPALERAFLDAQVEIWASFLVFDLATPLRSDQARAVGTTWFDLVVHTLKRGVALNIVIGDADPVFHPSLHQSATRQLRLLHEAGAAAGQGTSLAAERLRHPAQIDGWGRLAVWPIVVAKLWRLAREINRLDPPARAARLSQLGVASLLRQRPDGRFRPRLLHLPKVSSATHRQKLAVIDRRHLYIGGLDLDGREFTALPQGKSGNRSWHDIQLMLEGPVVAEAQLHLESFRDVVEGKSPAPRTRRLIRTLSLARGYRPWNLRPKPLVTELRTAHLALLQRAKEMVYLETQHFEDGIFARHLVERGQRNPDLTVILMLPAIAEGIAPGQRHTLASRYRGAMQNRALSILRKGLGPRVFIGSPRWFGAPPPREASPQHPGSLQARMAIFDDSAAIISSADLTRRDMCWNTEAGLYLSNGRDVQELRYRVMTHWLPDHAGEEAFHPVTAVREWRRIADENARLAPDRRLGRILSHETAADEARARISAGPVA